MAKFAKAVKCPKWVKLRSHDRQSLRMMLEAIVAQEQNKLRSKKDGRASRDSAAEE